MDYVRVIHSGYQKRRGEHRYMETSRTKRRRDSLGRTEVPQVNVEKIHLEVKRFVRGRRYRLRGNGATES